MKVLIAHGDPIIAIGLETALRRCHQFEVHLRQDPAGMACAMRPGSFDVVVADFDTGMKLARDARGSCRVLIMTNDESEIGIRDAIEAGIRGYLLLDSTLESVAEAARRVGHGGMAIDPRAMTKMLESVSGNQLTDREIEVLRLIVLGLSNKAVANQLGIAVGTAKHHVKQLFTKLDARSRTEAANIAQRRGLVPHAGRQTRAFQSTLLGDKLIFS